MSRLLSCGLGVGLAGLLACSDPEPAAPPVDPRPDLQLVHVEMDLMARPVPALVAEVRNLGEGAAQGFGGRCAWTCRGTLYNTGLRIVDEGVLAAQASTSFRVPAPVDGFGCPGPPPVLELNCEIDDRGEIDERNELNNAWTGPVRLHW